ncbi:uncharacterized protein LOC141640722 [Silene latifolia]|uniref:uncharacterized protein LOC141640722 n=1 Tax=Silene latifolia TaxID=37657 RepID=UPI003D786837
MNVIIDYEVCHAKFLEFNRAATLFWKQRAKLHWLKEGDACTKFFFNTVRERYKKNFIYGIKQEDDSWSFEKNDLFHSFEKYFMDIYEASINHEPFESYHQKFQPLFQKLSTQLDNDQADGIPTKFQLGPTKFPCPDGIPALFFQKYWFHVKSEVTHAVLAMLNSCLIPSELNRTSITLVPKNNCLEKVTHYRPISLCNVIMRAVTKCVSNTMKPVMSTLVGEYQNGFIPSRSITDNILISQELFHHISKNSTTKKGSLALKVDMSKVYDRLRWNFIRATLTHMGFSSSFIRLIMNCVQSVTYEVMINGSSGKAFKPHTGQAINADKSAISFNPNCTLQFMQDCFRILKVLGRYLGLPTDFGISKRQVFAFLIEKVRKQILSWKNIFLSVAGRLTLICSILSSLSIYSLSAFRMSWGGCRAEKNIHWCSKLFTSYPKSMGGLGIRNVNCLNQSLLAKIGWKIVTNPLSLISRVLGGKNLITKATFMTTDLRKQRPFSWGGRSIRWGAELLNDNLAWEVGCPSTLDIWRDNWIHGCSLIAQLSNLSETETLSKPHLQVSSLQHANGNWNANMITTISRIWFPSPLGIQSHSGESISIQQWIINWVHFLKKSDDYITTVSAFIATLWQLWCLRNKTIFQNSSPDFLGIKRLISVDTNNDIWVQNQLHDRVSSREVLDPTEHEGASIIINHYPYMLLGPQLCPTLSIRIKCDATWKLNFKATSGWYFQDYSGSIFHFGQSSFWAKSPIQAEAMALQAAIVDATSQGFRHLDVASDSLNLVLQVNGFAETTQDAKSTIRCLTTIILSCHCFSLSHCPRYLNKIAHTIAKSIA